MNSDVYVWCKSKKLGIQMVVDITCKFRHKLSFYGTQNIRCICICLHFLQVLQFKDSKSMLQFCCISTNTIFTRRSSVHLNIIINSTNTHRMRSVADGMLHIIQVSLCNLESQQHHAHSHRKTTNYRTATYRSRCALQACN